ncbi:CopG family transcriptional regulator [Streptomyces chumphonensis]|uniref:ribbon-helix-helix domain-containing protein n=1 Tax=Streptomyces chumphonensis TaxID=1214925 RepID=UPI003D747642
MNRTTIKLDESLDARMRHEAARRGMTISEWTREAIAAHLPGEEESGTATRRRFRSTGAGASGRSDIAERMEEILAGLGEDRGTSVADEATPQPRHAA